VPFEQAKRGYSVSDDAGGAERDFQSRGERIEGCRTFAERLEDARSLAANKCLARMKPVARSKIS
jgi:hypothetical protein